MTKTHYKLVIGNRNYSSWSLRVWLHLKLSLMHDIEKGTATMEVVRIPLFIDNYKAKLLEHSPAGRVPIVIITREKEEVSSPITVWDSLAIMEFILDEQQLKQQQNLIKSNNVIGWPEDPVARAMARSIACEFHSGFLAIRDELTQNLRRQPEPLTQLSDACRQQIQRIDEIWTTCYEQQQQGEQKNDDDTRDPSDSSPCWLFGNTMTIADIMYVPVALRFWVYGIDISPSAQRFVNATRGHPFVQEWIAEAKAETEHLDFVDNLVPAAESPMVL
mmetsp:Transcript_2445/g.3456  ORF Transcript_2445/g.3456 Transcript_2445/m.3456 type:complete len:275 (+) Transcript_2445:89-913(+)